MNTHDHRQRFDLFWTARETSTILILCVLAVAAMIAFAASSRFQWIQSLPAADEQAQARFREKIDPNTASAASLRRLHGIGPAWAQAIVERRKAAGLFTIAADLEKVQTASGNKIQRLGPTRVSRIISELVLPGEKVADNQEPPTDESD